jgi:coenzyme F420-0:L-glutamate ligase / coenzyme F420-1:gamma-L-glutamate ligase
VDILVGAVSRSSAAAGAATSTGSRISRVSSTTNAGPRLELRALPGIGEVRPGCDLADALAGAMAAAGLEPQHQDVLVIAQKAVSKSEGRFVDLAEVEPSARALELARITGKDPRLVEVVLGESVEVLRARPNVLIVRHRLGLVMAQAGVDRSNVPGADRLLLLPLDPDRSATALRDRLMDIHGVDVGVIISDSFGRPWRLGTTNVAIGAAGVPALWDRRGEADREGRQLETTQVAWADAVAAGAGIAMGEAAEGTPAVLVRGLRWSLPAQPARRLLRPLDEDMFR